MLPPLTPPSSPSDPTKVPVQKHSWSTSAALGGGVLGLILGALAVAHFRGPSSFEALGVTGEALGLIGSFWGIVLGTIGFILRPLRLKFGAPQGI